MQMQNTALVCSVVCLTCVVVVLSQPKKSEGRPYGPKMCSSLCSNTIGCYSSLFSMTHLTCHVKMTSQRGHFTNGLSSFQNPVKGPRNKRSCLIPSTLLHSRTRGVTCVSLTTRSSQTAKPQPDPKSKETGKKSISLSNPDLKTAFAQNKTKPSLLLATYWVHEKHNILLVHPDGRKYEMYLNIHFASIISMTYVWKHRQVIVSTFKPSVITSFVVNKPGLTTLKSDIISRGMSVDEDEDLVFILSSWSNEMNSMSLDGKKFKKITFEITLKNIKSIEVDQIGKLLFLSRHRTLFCASYNGTNVREIYNTPNPMHGLTFKYTENALYFGEDCDVMKLILVNKTVSRVQKLKYVVFYLECYGDDIFVSFFERLTTPVGVIHKSVYRSLKATDIGGKGLLTVIV